MQLQHSLLALLAINGLQLAAAARKPANSVLLSSVQTLTLRKDQKTTHRRVSAIPQLKCIGGNAKGLHEIDVMRCSNAGSDYDDASVQWTCKAALPSEFKLGSTDVVCEGYSSPDDPYILKGSCGVEYRLLLTERGEEKYGKQRAWWGAAAPKPKPKPKPKPEQQDEGEENFAGKLVGTVFWLLLAALVIWILLGACGFLDNGAGNRRPRRPREPRAGGGWPGDDNDNPPPYDWRPPRPKPKPTPSYPGTQQGWRPGFWSGAATGAAAGYAAGSMAADRSRRQQQQQQQQQQQNRGGSSWFGGGGENAAGPSGTSSSSGSDGPPSSARYESTGFGSTRRR